MTATQEELLTTPDPWICQVCGEHYVVPTLARACEAKHRRNR